MSSSQGPLSCMWSMRGMCIIGGKLQRVNLCQACQCKQICGLEKHLQPQCPSGLSCRLSSTKRCRGCSTSQHSGTWNTLREKSQVLAFPSLGITVRLISDMSLQNMARLLGALVLLSISLTLAPPILLVPVLGDAHLPSWQALSISAALHSFQC